MEYGGFTIVSDGTFGYSHIKPKGKGSVPVVLRGAYTKSSVAQSAIDNYNNAKGKKNDKAEVK